MSIGLEFGELDTAAQTVADSIGPLNEMLTALSDSIAASATGFKGQAASGLGEAIGRGSTSRQRSDRPCRATRRRSPSPPPSTRSTTASRSLVHRPRRTPRRWPVSERGLVVRQGSLSEMEEAMSTATSSITEHLTSTLDAVNAQTAAWTEETPSRQAQRDTERRLREGITQLTQALDDIEPPSRRTATTRGRSRSRTSPSSAERRRARFRVPYPRTSVPRHHGRRCRGSADFSWSPRPGWSRSPGPRSLCCPGRPTAPPSLPPGPCSAPLGGQLDHRGARVRRHPAACWRRRHRCGRPLHLRVGDESTGDLARRWRRRRVHRGPSGRRAGHRAGDRGAAHPLPRGRRGLPEPRHPRAGRDAARRGDPGVLAAPPLTGRPGLPRGHRARAGRAHVVAVRPGRDRPRRLARAWPRLTGEALCAVGIGTLLLTTLLFLPPPSASPASVVARRRVRRTPRRLRRVGARGRPVARAGRRTAAGPDHGRGPGPGGDGAGDVGRPPRRLPAGHRRARTAWPSGWSCWRSWVASACGSCWSTCPPDHRRAPDPVADPGAAARPGGARCLAVAILRYRLDEIEPTVRRTLVQAMVVTLVGPRSLRWWER